MHDLLIGPSTGWMYAKDIFDLGEQEEIARKAGANALEMCTSGITERTESLLSKPRRFTDSKFRTVHLGYDGDRSLPFQIDDINRMYKAQGFDAGVEHPVDIPDAYWTALREAGIPVCAENMDSRNTQGVDIMKLEALLQRFDLGLVIDAQHAYEHDKSMTYAWELLEMGEERLTYLHVSGNGEQGNRNHELVINSKNKSKIMEFSIRVMERKRVPIILEGRYEDGEQLKEEIDFIRGVLSTV